MTERDETVFITVHDDGSADFTIRVDGDNHKFSASVDGSQAELEYEESMSWLGRRGVGSPGEYVWKRLMQSDAMTRYLEEHGLESVQRKHDRQ